jgi:hypothetical protein
MCDFDEADLGEYLAYLEAARVRVRTFERGPSEELARVPSPPAATAAEAA